MMRPGNAVNKYDKQLVKHLLKLMAENDFNELSEPDPEEPSRLCSLKRANSCLCVATGQERKSSKSWTLLRRLAEGRHSLGHQAR